MKCSLKINFPIQSLLMFAGGDLKVRSLILSIWIYINSFGLFLSFIVLCCSTPQHLWKRSMEDKVMKICNLGRAIVQMHGFEHRKEYSTCTGIDQSLYLEVQIVTRRVYIASLLLLCFKCKCTEHKFSDI